MTQKTTRERKRKEAEGEALRSRFFEQEFCCLLADDKQRTIPHALSLNLLKRNGAFLVSIRSCQWFGRQHCAFVVCCTAPRLRAAPGPHVSCCHSGCNRPRPARQVRTGGTRKERNGDRRLMIVGSETCLSSQPNAISSSLSILPFFTHFYRVLNNVSITSGSMDDEIFIWDTSSKVRVHMLIGHRAAVQTLAVLGNGLLLR